MGGDKLETNENILKILLSTVLVKIGLFLHRFELQRCFKFQPILPYNQMEHEIEHSMPQITQNVDRKIGF